MTKAILRSDYIFTRLGGKKTIYVKGDYYDWNNDYKHYASRKTNEKLRWADLGLRSSPKRKK